MVGQDSIVYKVLAKCISDDNNDPHRHEVSLGLSNISPDAIYGNVLAVMTVFGHSSTKAVGTGHRSRVGIELFVRRSRMGRFEHRKNTDEENSPQRDQGDFYSRMPIGPLGHLYLRC
jgi:hypothetical protein